MVEYGWGELVEPVVGGSYAEKVVHDGVDGGVLTEFPRNCWGVVTP